MKFAVSFLLNILIFILYLQITYGLIDYIDVAVIIIYLILGIMMYVVSYMYLHIFRKIKSYIKRKLYERKQKIKK